MTPEGYVQALVDYAEAIDDVGPLERERDALFARINSGKESKTIVNAGLNGKTFGFIQNMSPEEKFTALCQAVKIYHGNATPMTFAVFGTLQR